MSVLIAITFAYAPQLQNKKTKLTNQFQMTHVRCRH